MGSLPQRFAEQEVSHREKSQNDNPDAVKMQNVELQLG